jgi:spoIIIJ-associated protein
MTKVEAPTLEEAYELAATQLSCSVTELQYEVIQYPSKGVLGLFKKQAIIVATAKVPVAVQTPPPEPAPTPQTPTVEEETATEILSTLKEEITQTVTSDETEQTQEMCSREETVKDDAIVEGFFEADHAVVKTPDVDVELAQSIEESMKHLFDVSCFDIDVVEVDVVDNTALIFIDGEDAALLIGKEGYRYNALSYMLFNWLHTKYQLYIKLEIAEFLTSQQEMIRNYIQPVIENVEKYGKGKTRFLDGILVQIALEQLREAFPNKYVAVKTGKSGKKFVVINEFHTKPHV